MKSISHLYSQVPIKGGRGPTKRGSEKIPKSNKLGVGILERWLYMMVKGKKEQKQVVIKHRAKIYTEALYSTLNSECE